jgi:hypothetical protein
VAGNYGRTTGVSDGWPANFSVLPLVGAMPSGHGTREVNWPTVTRIFAGHQDRPGFSFILQLGDRRAQRSTWSVATGDQLQARRALAVAGPSVTRALHNSQGEVSASCLHTSPCELSPSGVLARAGTRHECASRKLMRTPAVRLYARLQVAVTVCFYTVNTCAEFFLLQGNTFSRQRRRRISSSGDGGRAGRPRYFHTRSITVHSIDLGSHIQGAVLLLREE